MGVGKKMLYIDVTQSSTVAQAYRFVEDKEEQRDFKLMYKKGCLEKSDSKLMGLMYDFASDVMVQPVDGLLGGSEKKKDLGDCMKAIKACLDACELSDEEFIS